MSKYCDKCGSRLDEATGFCPSCDADVLAYLYEGNQDQRIETDEDIVLPRKRQRERPHNSERSKRLYRSDTVQHEAQDAEEDDRPAGHETILIVVLSLLIIFLVVTLAGLLISIFIGVNNVPFLSSILNNNGLVSEGSGSAETALDAELKMVLNNECGIHFLSPSGEPVSSLQGGNIQERIMSCISYQLIDGNVQPSSATIRVEFTYPDVVSMAEKYVTEGNDPKLFSEWIHEHLEEKAEYQKKTVSFLMIQKDGTWEITIPSELYEILSGGMQSYMQEKSIDTYNEMKEGKDS